jgi:lysophospholipase L1-like esterase
MADTMETKRIINLPAESTPADGDVFVVDNEATGTKKLPITGLIDPTPTQGSNKAASSGGVWSNTLNVYRERINADNYQTYGITDIISMPTNKYAVFYTLPDNAKRITAEMVANLPSYNHAYVCVLKTSPTTNSYASYIAWGFTSNTGVEAVYVANGKGSTSNTPWVKIWDASVNADSIAQKLDIANMSNVALSFPERINKDNLSTYEISSAVNIPANRYIAFSTNPALSTAITESDISGLPSYSHNFLTVLKLAPVSNPYASYIAWGFNTVNGVEAIYIANGLGSTSNTPWVKIWDKDNNLDGHFKSNKKVSIIGDSISTFTGYVPTGYATYYPRQDVTSVDNLWWKIALDKTGMSLLKNASWASSTVAGDDTQGAVVASSDARIADLADGNTKPDIVIVLIGTNDFGRSYSIGTFTDTDTIPASSNIADFKPAYAKMIGKIHAAYPEAKVFACTLIPRTFSGGGYPAKDQNNQSLYAFNKAIKDIAEMMNCSVIDINMDSDINVDNLPNHFIQESSGSYIHPLASGQSLVGECVARELIKGVTL